MRKNKRRKTPLIILIVALVALSAYMGRFTGKNSDFLSGTLPGDKIGWSNSSDNNESGIDENTLTGKDGNKIFEIQPQPSTNANAGMYTTEIFEKVNPSTVCINIYREDYIEPIASGSGIIMSSDGYIITNAHVVEGASKINIIFSDGKEMAGNLVGADADTDLAVVKVNGHDLPMAQFGDSDKLKIGEKVVAIGNAGGLSGSCTEGIVSGLNREMDSNLRSLKLIQTSAAINPGNSGGPLVNRFGQVVGITSSKIASLDYEGIGFAIPITQALPILQSLLENGYVTGRAILGISVITLNTANGPANGLPSRGAYIAQMSVDSDLGNLGVREGDVIIEANGVEIDTAEDLITQLNEFYPGDTINIGVYRPKTDETFYVDAKLLEYKGK